MRSCVMNVYHSRTWVRMTHQGNSTSIKLARPLIYSGMASRLGMMGRRRKP
jgi:hypothetical protein